MERYIHTYRQTGRQTDRQTDKVTWVFFLRMRLLASPFGLAIRYTPLFQCILMALRVLEKLQILPERLGLDFFVFFLSRSNDDLHFLHKQNCCRIIPHGATVSFTLWGPPVFPHMRRVKYGVFKNIQKILKIKLKSFSWCQKIQNSSLFTNIHNKLQ
jgi:hypothetical protein